MKKLPVSIILTLLIFCAVGSAAVLGLRASDEARAEEGARVLADGIRRAAVCCYAVEGAYPDTIEYLSENYGVYIDYSQYAVFYEVFASNLMPGVDVVRLP